MSLPARPRRIRECSFRPIGEEGGLVVLPGRSEVKVLNPVAITVFPLLDGEHTVDQIVDHILGEFEVDREQARVDLESFLAQLAEHGMIESGTDATEDDPS
jgi:hypothetical protein